MKKLKLFVENFVVYGLGGIVCKMIPLIMVPIVTRLMPNTTYFGLSDLSNMIISFAQAFAVMGMYDAMFRMFFDKDDVEHKKRVCSTALFFTMATSGIVFLIMLFTKDIIADFFISDKQYAYLVYICAVATLVGATNSIVAAPTRMQNKKGIYIFTNVASALLSYSIAVPLLLKGHYIIALPLANMLSALVIEVIFLGMNYKWFDIRKMDFVLLKQMLVLAIPTLPSFLIYWLFNSGDRLMIANILSIEEEGIYAVGSKLGHVSQLIYTAFAGGWQYFSFALMNEKEQVKDNSKIFEYLGIISFASTAFCCAMSYLAFKILFTEEYITGYVVAPYLFLAPLLQMLFQVAGTQLWKIKRTWPNMLFLLFGAVLNIVLNFIMIPRIGIEGAALATLIGYLATLSLSVTVLRKMGLMLLSKKFLLSGGLLVIYMVCWRLLFREVAFIGVILATMLTSIYVCLYRDDLKGLLKVICNEKCDRKKRE